VYAIRWVEDAKAELRLLRVFHSRILAAAVEDQLRHEAEVETNHRKPLLSPVVALPDATWELRVGAYRVFYCIEEGQTVTVLRVILKGTATTDVAVGKGRQS